MAEKKVSVLQALVNIQKNLVAPKDKNNSFGGYKYRSAESILEAAKKLCAENNVAITCEDEIVLIGDRYYVKATARLTEPETGEYVEKSAYARESADKKGMDLSQLTGACSSYARKYALCGLLAIDDSKDADTEEFHREAQKRSTKEDEKVQAYKALLKSAKQFEVTKEDIENILFEVLHKDFKSATAEDFLMLSKDLPQYMQQIGNNA